MGLTDGRGKILVSFGHLVSNSFYIWQFPTHDNFVQNKVTEFFAVVKYAIEDYTSIQPNMVQSYAYLCPTCQGSFNVTVALKCF